MTWILGWYCQPMKMLERVTIDQSQDKKQSFWVALDNDNVIQDPQLTPFIFLFPLRRSKDSPTYEDLTLPLQTLAHPSHPPVPFGSVVTTVVTKDVKMLHRIEQIHLDIFYLNLLNGCHKLKTKTQINKHSMLTTISWNYLFVSFFILWISYSLFTCQVCQVIALNICFCSQHINHMYLLWPMPFQTTINLFGDN